MDVPPAALDARAPVSDEQLDLKLKRVAIDTNLENVVYLNRDCLIYRIAGFQALSKVEVVAGEHRITATLNVVDDIAIISPDEIGLSEDAFKRFEKDAYHAIVRDITGGHYSKI